MQPDWCHYVASPARVLPGFRLRCLLPAQPVAYGERVRMNCPGWCGIQGNSSRSQPAPHCCEVLADEPKAFEQPEWHREAWRVPAQHLAIDRPTLLERLHVAGEQQFLPNES